jgi:hypothetical protein
MTILGNFRRDGAARGGKLLRWAYPALVAVAISGCATSTAKIDSFTIKEHTGIHRLLLASNVWPPPSEGTSNVLEMPVLEAAIANAFNNCGIVTDILPRGQLSLPDDTPPAVRAFSPDALFTLESKKLEVGIAEGGGVYLIKIVDMTAKQMIWQAQISITAGKSREEVLATAIVDQLKKDRLLCAS